VQACKTQPIADDGGREILIRAVMEIHHVPGSNARPFVIGGSQRAGEARESMAVAKSRWPGRMLIVAQA